MMYVQDFDETYPTHGNGVGGSGAEYWPQFIEPYIRNLNVYTRPSRPDITYSGGTDTTIAYGFNYWLDYWYYKDATLAAISRPAETVFVAETGSGAQTPGLGFYLCYALFTAAFCCATIPRMASITGMRTVITRRRD